MAKKKPKLPKDMRGMKVGEWRSWGSKPPKGAKGHAIFSGKEKVTLKPGMPRWAPIEDHAAPRKKKAKRK